MTIKRSNILVVTLLLIGSVAVGQDIKSETPREHLDHALEMLRQGRTSVGQEQLAEATKRLQAQVTANPQDADAQYDLGRAMWAAGRAGPAIAAFTEAVNHAPDNKEYRLARLGYLRAVGRLGDTIKDIKAALDESPDDADYWVELGRSYLASRRYDEAYKAFMRVKELDDEHERLYHGLGTLYARQRKLDEAIEAFEVQAKRFPDHFDSHFNLAQIHQLRGETQLAMKHFAEADRISPDDPGTLAKLVQSYQEIGDLVKRDEIRRRIVLLFRDGRVKADRYCRDQFVHDDKRVIVLEHFELKPPEFIKYDFIVYNHQQTRLHFKIRLASSDYTTKISIASGQIRPGQRIYHLDMEVIGEHRSYGFYKAEPTYDRVRDRVMKILDGKIKPDGTLILGR